MTVKPVHDQRVKRRVVLAGLSDDDIRKLAAGMADGLETNRPTLAALVDELVARMRS